MSHPYFKHYCDAHRGRSMNELMERFGHMGPNCYWILVSLCIDKFWEFARNNRHIEYKDIPPEFSFHRRALCQELRIKTKRLDQWLLACVELELFSVFPNINSFHSEQSCVELCGTSVGSQNVLKITMPKLLEIFERGRKKRGQRPTPKAPHVPPDSNADTNANPPNPQTQTAETDPNANAEQKTFAIIPPMNAPPGQLLIPGLLVPSETRGALDMLDDAKRNRNTSRSGKGLAKGLTPAADVISKIVKEEK